MAWPYLDGVIKIVISYTIGGEVAINVVFVRTQDESSATQIQMQAAATKMYDALDAEWIPVVSDTVDLVDVEAIEWRAPDGILKRAVGTFPLAGDHTSNPMPANVALVVSHRTGHVGRSKRGRSYMLGFTESDVSGNIPTAALALAASDTFTVYNTDIDADDLELIVYSLYEDGSARTTPASTPVTSHQVDLRVDTQRRRLGT